MARTPRILLALAACVSCGTEPDPHAIEHPWVNLNYAQDPDLGTFARSLNVDLEDGGMVLSVFSATPGDDAQWTATCTAQELSILRSLASQARVDHYVAESEPFGNNPDPHCTIVFFMPPHEEQHVVRLSASASYSADTTTMMSFLVDLYEAYPSWTE